MGLAQSFHDFLLKDQALPPPKGGAGAAAGEWRGQGYAALITSRRRASPQPLQPAAVGSKPPHHPSRFFDVVPGVELKLVAELINRLAELLLWNWPHPTAKLTA